MYVLPFNHFFVNEGGMPANVDSRCVFLESRKLFNNAAFEDLISKSALEVKFDGKQYLAIPDKNLNSKNPNLKNSYVNYFKDSIVGSLTINRRQYIIVKPHENILDNKPDKEHENLVNILTKRELQVVILVAEGKVNKQVARLLNISEWTVSTYMRRIFCKLGVDSRAAMVHRCADILQDTSQSIKTI